MLIYSGGQRTGRGWICPGGGMALSGVGGRAHRERGRLCPAGPPGGRAEVSAKSSYIFICILKHKN
ncbi:MAG: hypothetical protein WAV83_03620 [Methanothrix sp.]